MLRLSLKGVTLKNFSFVHALAAVKAEDGMTTAEYAVGTVAAAGLGGVLVKMLSSTEVQAMLWSIIQHALNVFLG